MNTLDNETFLLIQIIEKSSHMCSETYKNIYKVLFEVAINKETVLMEE